MFEEIGEYTLCEFEIIERPGKNPIVDYNPVSPQSDEPVLLQFRDAFSPTPLSPISAGSPCSSSPYSFLSPQTSHTSSPCPSNIRRGRVLTASDFRPIRKLGKGGYGTVYLVEDVVSERYLAMKVIQKNGLRLREYPAVFEEQAVTKTLATDACEEGIGSPLSVPLAGSFEDSDNFYFLTDYYPHGDLMKWMKRHGTVPVHQARLWCAELLVALQRLHKRRIIHRDVKPDNILIDEDYHIALTDFGIARAFGADHAERPWTRLPPWNMGRDSEDSERRKSWMKGKEGDETNTLAGTPGYVAPEVYSGKYSYEVDVWGAGVVLYSMLVGKLPFGLRPKEQRLEELITRTDTIPADFDLYGVVDGEIRDLLTKMLEKDPKKRPSIRKLKKHRWFHGIDWDVVERRERNNEALVDHMSEDVEDVDVSYGRPYDAFERPPHEWFEWVSPNLCGIEGPFDTTNEWSLGSTCYTDCDLTQSEDGFAPIAQSPVASARKDPKPRVMQKMKGWMKRMSTS